MNNEQEYSEDYPIGGMVEPYDIEREQELLDSSQNLALDKITQTLWPLIQKN